MQGRGIMSANNHRRLILSHEGGWEASRQWQGEGLGLQGTEGLGEKDVRLRAHGCLWVFRTELN